MGSGTSQPVIRPSTCLEYRVSAAMISQWFVLEWNDSRGGVSDEEEILLSRLWNPGIDKTVDHHSEGEKPLLASLLSGRYPQVVGRCLLSRLQAGLAAAGFE